ncbi:hypothetical protein BWQ96_08471 [Gracilariopsis chorda]|uniref:Uncharacterized protein n=1 Tax=Gracilariopsis chorda TaxID=448386 RepID=A0A2V3IIG9_9FLOR|nr:hypothetical protein BWQ96_08471 [Gracilariopsis chorda]|eukprot:PXF41823.1 hypothetical protein BWQ96_08471 [Gracilariopsis chorda]
MEKDFVDRLIQHRARLLCDTAVNNMKLECSVTGLPPTRCGLVVLFANGVLHQLLEWLNAFIRLNDLDEPVPSLTDMYRYVAVLLLSHTTGLSFDKTVSVLRQSGSIVPSLDRVRFIAENILVYSLTGRGTDGEFQWNSQRDQTRQLSEFEHLALCDTRKVFFSPLHLLATLDDDLFGTRAANNQFKMISSRKAEREGHSADALADALFRIVLAIRFR